VPSCGRRPAARVGSRRWGNPRDKPRGFWGEMQQIYGRKVCEKLGKTREKTKTRGEFTQQKKHKKKGKYIVFTDPKMQIGDKEWGKT